MPPISDKLKVLGPAAISGATGLVSSVLGAAAQNRQYRLQQKENERAYQRQRADYLKDRAHDEIYNSPALQKNRLRQAGLNPQTFMDAPVASSSAANGAEFTPAVAPDMSGPIGNLANSGVMAMQSALQSSQILENLENVGGKRLNNGVLAATANDLIKEVKLRNNETFQRTRSLLADCQLKSEQTKNVHIKNMYDRAAMPLLLRNLELQNSLADLDVRSKDIELSYADRMLKARLDNLWSDTRLKLAEKDESIARTFKVKQDAFQARQAFALSLEAIKSNIALNYAQTGKVNAEKVNITWDNKLLESTFDTKVRQFELEFKQAVKDYHWTNAKNAGAVFKDFAVGVGAAIGGFGQLLKF